MKAMKHLDLESKEGKAPGGFNYPLYEIGAPFIYNAVGSQRDLVTMVHEGGHAIHSFLRDLPLADFKSVPSEVAELASMSMELISMDTWDEFYHSQEELNRAKKEQMQKVMEGLPWIAAIDRFQQWIYTTPHTADERRSEWSNIMSDLSSLSIGTVMKSSSEHMATTITFVRSAFLLYRIWNGSIGCNCYVEKL